MIRTLLTTTAIAVVMSTSAYAQDANTNAPATTETAPAATDSMAPAAGSTDANASTNTDASAGASTSTDAAASDNNAMDANAQASQSWDMSAGYTRVDSDSLVSKMMGMPVYSSAGDDAEEIGTINDLVLGENGEINAVVIGVGGFLGIGEKNVAVDFGSLEFTIAADNTERWVLPTTADALNAAPEFTWEDDEPADNMAPAADGGAMAPAAPAADNAMAPAADPNAAPADANAAPVDPNAAPADPAAAPDANAAPAADDSAAMAPADQDDNGMQREGYNTIEVDALTAENLTGATVIGPDGEDIAEVGDILLTQDGKIDAMLIDFGGFLGIGQKRVAVALDNIEFAANEDGDIVVYTNFTKEQLEAQPEYNEDTYANEPNQRLTAQ
ncbi:PRC-barrel domain-containing protein [Devosia sp. PTR5]|uniref:PRC-barrel domain-containing protein n=1 Tax=Devosia oryzisoli TaxID=2774138 RepID=A0A927IUI6_9HYPH|nr:PRC-barrel domain-containing protein [Devosia oryzisoli]MBD8066962.1 PRC-barrel domain-containing protein [Devosia oryzisoli]